MYYYKKPRPEEYEARVPKTPRRRATLIILLIDIFIIVFLFAIFFKFRGRAPFFEYESWRVYVKVDRPRQTLFVTFINMGQKRVLDATVAAEASGWRASKEVRTLLLPKKKCVVPLSWSPREVYPPILVRIRIDKEWFEKEVE